MLGMVREVDNEDCVEGGEDGEIADDGRSVGWRIAIDGEERVAVYREGPGGVSRSLADHAV